ncbi:MAG: hypothetical protein ACM3II_00595 [Rhodospirillaceae bacterium]
MRVLVAILAGLIGGLIGAAILASVIADVDQAIEGSFEGGYAWFGLMLGGPIGFIGGFVLFFWGVRRLWPARSVEGG